MQSFELFRSGLRSLWQRRFRTLLTILGIVFGVAAVIAMLAIGNGARVETIKIIEKFGATSITVKALELDQEQIKVALRKGSAGLSLEDSRYLKAVCPFIQDLTGQLKIFARLRYGDQEPKANLIGIEENYFKLTGLKIKLGRFFTPVDFKKMKKVCLIGAELAKKLFGEGSPTGKMVIIGPYHFEIVGILASREMNSTSVGGGSASINVKTRDINKDVYVPASVAKYVLPRLNVFKARYNSVDELLIKINKKENISRAKQLISKILTRRHKGTADFEMIIPYEILEQSQKTLKIFNIVMVCIAGLSLLIGGIGIMNIMLANVSERIKEIGIRRAVGASRSNILAQFLMESVLISCLGGLVGILLGKGLSLAVSMYAGWRTITTIEAIVLSFGVSALVGIIFGFFPAHRAAYLNPIDALRTE
ncbi:ABC transporter permease [Candidatus Riflebacteria bacterium]